jgi:hypothetical protein
VSGQGTDDPVRNKVGGALEANDRRLGGGAEDAVRGSREEATHAEQELKDADVPAG